MDPGIQEALDRLKELYYSNPEIKAGHFVQDFMMVLRSQENITNEDFLTTMSLLNPNLDVEAYTIIKMLLIQLVEIRQALPDSLEEVGKAIETKDALLTPAEMIDVVLTVYPSDSGENNE